MSLYPSLEDMKVDQLAQAQVFCEISAVFFFLNAQGISCHGDILFFMPFTLSGVLILVPNFAALHCNCYLVY